MFIHEFNLTKKRQVDVKSKFKRYYGIKKRKNETKRRKWYYGNTGWISGATSRRKERWTRHKAISIFPADEAPIKAREIKIQRIPPLEIV